MEILKMKLLSKLRLGAVVCLLGFGTVSSMAVDEFNKFVLHFVDSVEASKLLSTPDKNTNNWGKFDIEARMGRSGATRAEIMDMLKGCTRDFTQADKDSLFKAFTIFDDSLTAKGLSLPLPQEFTLVKTTMEEEGNAGAYTRGDIICVSEDVMKKVTADRLAWLVAHETFHVLTRDNPDFRRKMYSLIGFTVLDKEIEFSKDVTDRRISNPDVNRYDSYAMLTVDGVKSPYTMVIYSDRDYAGGSFFDYMKIGLIPLDGNFEPVKRDGKTVIVPLERATDFYDLVGKNTDYVINPEECLADNFATAICGTNKKLPTPELSVRIISAIRDEAKALGK